MKTSSTYHTQDDVAHLCCHIQICAVVKMFLFYFINSLGDLPELGLGTYAHAE
jgi:hypothetical protein